MLHVCFITSEYPSPMRGGIERVTCNLMAEFGKRGVASFAVSKLSPAGRDAMAENSLALPEPAAPCSQGNVDFLVKLCTERNVGILINNSHEDVLLELSSLVKKRLPQLKIVSCVHSDPAGGLISIKDELAKFFFSPVGWWGKLKNAVRFWVRYPYRCISRKRWFRTKYRRLYEKSDAVVLLTPRTISAFQAISGIRTRERLSVIPNVIGGQGVDDLPEKEPWILWVGRMQYHAKRPDRMIRVWEKICDQTSWQLKMIGDGDARKDLETYCRRHSIKNVEFLGQQDPETFYRKAQILCVTSSTESFHMAMLEAMMHSVAPMAFDSYPASRDLIRHGENGILIPNHAIREYARQLLTLTRSPELRQTLSQNARRAARQYTADTVIPKWKRLLDDLVKEK